MRHLQATYRTRAILEFVLRRYIIAGGDDHVGAALARLHRVAHAHATVLLPVFYLQVVLTALRLDRESGILAAERAFGIAGTIFIAERLTRHFHVAEVVDVNGQAVDTTYRIVAISVENSSDGDLVGAAGDRDNICCLINIVIIVMRDLYLLINLHGKVNVSLTLDDSTRCFGNQFHEHEVSELSHFTLRHVDIEANHRVSVVLFNL